jgi:hypothetical protein
LEPSWIRLRYLRDDESVSRDVDLCRDMAKLFGGKLESIT